MYLLVLLAGAATAGDCERVVSQTEIRSLLEDAMLAYSAMDDETFATSTHEARRLLPCVDEVFEPTGAAAFHRLAGMQAFYDGDPDAAESSFRASIAIRPDTGLSELVAPEGGKLHRAWQSAASAPGPDLAPLPISSGYRLFVDGQRGSEIPVGLPYIAQLTTRSGDVDWSGYVEPGAPMPRTLIAAMGTPGSSPAGAESEPEVASTPIPKDGPRKPERSRRGVNSGLLVAAAGSAVVAGALFGTSAMVRGQYDEDPTQGRYTLTNGTYVGAVSCAGLTVGLSGLAFAVGGGR